MNTKQVRVAHGIPRARLLAFAAAAALFCTPHRADSELRFSVIWFSPTADDDRVARTASRYQIGGTGTEMPSANHLTIKALNPDFRWFVYNSGADNYVPPHPSTPEHDLLVQKAAARGWDVEEAYMHYWDDTQVTLQGQTLFIPGWGGGSATDPAQARVPVYYSSLVRRLINASTPRARQLHKEVFVQLAFDTPFAGSNVYPDGMFLDNSTWQVFNYGMIVSGGHVREATGRPVIGTPAFNNWYWYENYAPYLVSLRDSLSTASSWSKDHKPKYLSINIANAWTDSYATLGVADVLSMEFEYNPVRDFGVHMVAEAHRRDRLAADAGIASIYSATTLMRSVPGRVGEFSYGQIMLSNLAWYLVSRTELTYFFEMGTATPNTAGWDTLTWRGCLDVADRDLGESVGEPYIHTQGTDPLGNAYAVYARAYENGRVFIRSRGDWDEGIEPQTAVPVTLGQMLYPVRPDGTNGPGTTQISLRAGEGAMLLNAPVAVDLLSFTATREDGAAVLRWDVAGDMSDVAGFHVYREVPGSERERLTNSLLSGSLSYTFTDPNPPAGTTHYWLEEMARDGNLTWHGPVLLLGLEEPVRLTLTQNRPNPFRERTEFSFALATTGTPVRLRVLDIRGREVARLLDKPMGSGAHLVPWDGRDHEGVRLAPGLYLYEIETPEETISSKLVILP